MFESPALRGRVRELLYISLSEGINLLRVESVFEEMNSVSKSNRSSKPEYPAQIEPPYPLLPCRIPACRHSDSNCSRSNI